MNGLVKLEFEFILFLITYRNPFLSIVSLIETFTNLAIWKNIDSLVILFTGSPVTKISSSIDPDIYTKAMLLVILILAMVHSSILPLVGTATMHHVLLPLTCIDSSIAPEIDTVSADSVVLPLSEILVSIRPSIDTLAFFL